MWAEAYLRTMWHLDPSSRLCPFGRGGAGSPSKTHCGEGRGLPACQVSSWSVEPFGHNTPTFQTGETECASCRQQGHAGSNTLHQQNHRVLSWWMPAIMYQSQFTQYSVEHNRQKADRKIYTERVQNMQLRNLSKSWLNDIQMLATHKQFWPAGCPA